MTASQQQAYNDATRQGYAPIHTPIVDFQWGELPHVVNPVPGQNVLQLQVTRSLLKRKIYCFMFGYAADTTINYWVRASMVMSLGNASKGPKIPFEIGFMPNANLRSSSLVHFTTGSTTPYPDGITVNFSVPFQNCPINAVLVPHYINGEMDTISFNIEEVKNVTELKVFLACESNQS